jgi:Flp pilus assembly protein TadG
VFDRLQRRLGGFGRDRSGATAVETALVTPVLMMFLYAVFELGWAMQCGSSVREAVEHGSRALISNPEMTAEQLTERVNARLEGLPIENLEVSVAQEWVTGNAQVARVTWTYDYQLSMPLIPQTLFHFGNSVVVPRAEA